MQSLMELNVSYPGSLIALIQELTLIRGSEDQAILEALLGTLFTVEHGRLIAESFLGEPQQIFLWSITKCSWVKEF